MGADNGLCLDVDGVHTGIYKTSTGYPLMICMLYYICMLYFNEKIKRKRVVWKGARGGIWNNIWAVIPRVPKPMGKAVSPYFVSYLMVYR